jgi:hypothetical protein
MRNAIPCIFCNGHWYVHSQQVLYAVPKQPAPPSTQMSNAWMTRWEMSVSAVFPYADQKELCCNLDYWNGKHCKCAWPITIGSSYKPDQSLHWYSSKQLK